jgi:cyclophilin family peptidyl-prolyl cis-trans isomerase
MSKRTREKQLAKLAARRAAERRRHRRNRAIALGLAVVLTLGAGGAVALTLIRDEPGQEEKAGTQNKDDQAKPEEVACNAKAPKSAGEKKPQFQKPPKLDLREDADYAVTLVTSCGRIDLDLYEDATPITVNNFVFLAEKGFYHGTTFHRLVDSQDLTVIQGGDPEGTGSGGPGYQFEDEIVKSLKFDRPGLLAMANPGTPDTNGSQFFIALNEPAYLNGAHTIFGEVTDGMPVVREINSIPTLPGDVPEQAVYIEKVIVRIS